MSQDHKGFPCITKAAVSMAACNGALNRDNPVERLYDRLDSVLGAEGVYFEDLLRIEAWLATLDGEQLLTLVDGEESEMGVLLAQSPSHAAGLMDDIWNNVVCL